MIKRSTSIIAACVLISAAALAAAPASAQSEWSWGADAAFLSKYVWRGQTFTDGWVLQPDIWFSNGGFTFDIWANIDMSDANELAWQVSEVDYTAEYVISLPRADLTLGAGIYEFPHTGSPGTTEIYAGFSPSDVPLNPQIFIYFDVDQAEGAYVEARLSSTLHGGNKAAIADWMVHLGWGSGSYNAYYFGEAGAGFRDLTIELSRSFDIGGGFTLTPSATWYTLLSDDLRDASPDDSDWAIGIIASYAP
ncbi:MAG: hypothetical protein HRF49_05975 [bacterium]|jgi:hypothetical protein